jgi:N-acetylmuramic acid 6-phosphate (MurNAc-6-P) etherase
MNQKRSITETPNSLSSDIDLASPAEIVRILRQADAQIFAGYRAYPGLYDSATIDCLASLARRAAQTIASPNGTIVLSGAGTSGRLAMFITRVFNQALQRPAQPVFQYLMAGGNAALIQAQEGAEDDPNLAIKDLRNATAGKDDVFYVGITCGLSAPYIAAQLEEMLPRNDGHAVLLGFNPVELSRDTPIEGWPHTFRYSAERTAAAANATVLNPVIGPEPITGSTRMKSGSATKILLEVLFHAAISLAKANKSPRALRQ